MRTDKDLSVKETKTEIQAYRRAVRQHCLDCSGGSTKEAEWCKVKGCALWSLRPKCTKEVEK